jgi:hypothetical protein
MLPNMSADSAQIALERVLAAVGQCLDRQSAESLLRLRADTEMQERIEELADKCTEGRLTPEERVRGNDPCRKFRCHSASESSSTLGAKAMPPDGRAAPANLSFIQMVFGPLLLGRLSQIWAMPSN